MSLQILSDLRTAVRDRLRASYVDVPVYIAEITNLETDDEDNISEFMTVFFGDGDEDQTGEDLDGETYRSDSQLTVGYFNEEGRIDQSLLDAQAAIIRPLILDQSFDGDITRAGWQYVPPIEGATAGIYFRFNISFSN